MNTQQNLSDMAAETAALPIGQAQLRQAQQNLRRYQAAKADLERRVLENEQWYKLRHWSCMRKGPPSDVEPCSGWLFNAIANKHADAMDHFPSPNVLPREAHDRAEAELLGAILPVVLAQNDFEETYDNVWDYKLKAGTGIYGVFWDTEKLGGLGDITIRKVDLLSLFWESGITDIQQSRNLFHVELMDNDLLLARYPQLEGQLGRTTDLGTYCYDTGLDTAGKSAVVDWYYKKPNAQGKRCLHYCKFVGDTLLFATENHPEAYPEGWYAHGLYPFVFDPLFSLEGTPCGFSYIDLGKSAQEYIDKGNQAILQNLLVNARPRHFIRTDGSVNEEEYADLSRDFVHVDGNLGQDSILPIQGKSLDSVYLQVVAGKIDELKEVTGNRDISTGGTTSGVTAASAIAAMQEAGSKLSRDANKSAYRAFRKVCLLVIELIRQFYDTPRCFRILGREGAARYIAYSNEKLRPQSQGVAHGVDLGWRLPLFDIEVTAQKQSPYSKMSQNELALQLFQLGFFDPKLAQQALACLDVMDFDRKQLIMNRIARNGQTYDKLMALAQAADPQAAEKLAQEMEGPYVPKSVTGFAQRSTVLGGSEKQEAANTRRARQQVAEAASPY